jgi:hypothetical protein
LQKLPAKEPPPVFHAVSARHARSAYPFCFMEKGLK